MLRRRTYLQKQEGVGGDARQAVDQDRTAPTRASSKHGRAWRLEAERSGGGGERKVQEVLVITTDRLDFGNLTAQALRIGLCLDLGLRLRAHSPALSGDEELHEEGLGAFRSSPQVHQEGWKGKEIVDEGVVSLVVLGAVRERVR